MDTALGLGLLALSRAHLAAEVRALSLSLSLPACLAPPPTPGPSAFLIWQFLALPVGRDMMLWNIIIGSTGLYAIDQEGRIFSEGAVPWDSPARPYVGDVCFVIRRG